MPAELGAIGAVLLGSLSDPAAVLGRTADGGFVVLRANEALARALELPPGELPDADGRALFGAEDERLVEHIERAFDEQREVGYETVRQRPHGRDVYLGTVVPVSMTEVVLIERDISDERRASSRLEELESLTQTGTWSWNLLDGDIHWSREFRRIIGVGEGFRANVDVAYDPVHPHDREILRRAMVDVRDNGVSEEITYRVVRPTGEQRTVCGRASRAVDHRGRPIRVFGTMQDITERRALEAGEEARQRMVRQQDRAMQLNDDVIQLLARAWLALDLDRPDEVRLAVTEAMATVRRIMAELLQAAGTLHGGSGRGLRPGELARLLAARSDRAADRTEPSGVEHHERQL